MCTRPGDIVIDCFAGVGNMARACEDLGRHCISVEIDGECHDSSLGLIGDQFSPSELHDDNSS